MIETYNMDRGTGKTTHVIEMMLEDEKLWGIVPTYNQRALYPKELRDRIICGSMDLQTEITSRRIKKVVLDEGFAYKKDTLAKIYYYFGMRNIDVVVYGTID